MLERAHAKRVIVMGIDGGMFTLLKKFVAEGKMPNTAKLIEKGAPITPILCLHTKRTFSLPLTLYLSRKKPSPSVVSSVKLRSI